MKQATSKNDYNGYNIQVEGKGFRVLPNAPGKVATFWVVNKQKKVKAIFVVVRSLLESMSHNETDDQVMGKFRRLIDNAIDKNEIANLKEYTYEFENGQFLFRKDPSWWQKTFK